MNKALIINSVTVAINNIILHNNLIIINLNQY
jgi:hypothetical protein